MARASFTVVPHGRPDHNNRVDVTLHYTGADGYTASYSGYAGGPKGAPFSALMSGGSRPVGDYVRMPTLSKLAGRDLYGYHIGGNYLIHGDIGSKGCIALHNFEQFVQDVHAHGKPNRLISRPGGYQMSATDRTFWGNALTSSGVRYQPEANSGGIDGWLNFGGNRGYEPSVPSRETNNPQERRAERGQAREEQVTASTGYVYQSVKSGIDGWLNFGNDRSEAMQSRQGRADDGRPQRRRSSRSEVRYSGGDDEVRSPGRTPNTQTVSLNLHDRNSVFSRG